MEAPFLNGEKDLRFFIGADDLKYCGKCRLIITDIKTCVKKCDVFVCDPPLYAGIINLVHMFFRREQAMSQLSVICDQEKPFRVLIKPSGRKQVCAPAVDQVEDCLLNRILCG